MHSDIALSLEFLNSHPLDAARVLEGIPVHDTALFIKSIPPDIAAGVMMHMDSLMIIRCSELMEPIVTSAIIQRLPLGIASMVLRKMDPALKDSVMTSIPTEIFESINLMLRYPEGTAGALMDPRYFVIPQDIDLKEALKRLQHHLKRDTSFIYVVTRDHELLGYINTHEFLSLDSETPISSIIHEGPWRLSAYSDRQQILMNPGWREFHTLPVVDEKGVFLGAIDYKTIRRIEIEADKTLAHSPLNQTVAAIGELFWVGLSGLVKGVASAVTPRKE